MGRLNHDQAQLFYSFSLEKVVPQDHLVRKIAAVLDLGWVHDELAPHYSSTGRPSIDPELMIRMPRDRLRICDPLGTIAVPRTRGQHGVSLVLRLKH